MTITSFQLKTIVAKRVPCAPRLKVEAEAEAAISGFLVATCSQQGACNVDLFEAASETKRHLEGLDCTRRLFIDDSLQCL
jgi:hypothetical protein